MIRLLVLGTVLSCLLCSCSFTLFEYTVQITPSGTEYANAATDTETTVNTPATDGPLSALAAITTPYDILGELLKNSQAIDAAKVLTIAVAGDPGAIAAWQARTPVSVVERKTLFNFKWREKE